MSARSLSPKCVRWASDVLAFATTTGAASTSRETRINGPTSKHAFRSPPDILMVGLSNYPMSATVTVHRVGLLDLTSMIELTIPGTGNPFNITTAVSPRYCAKRQRRASRGSVISIVCMQHRWSQYAIRFCDDQHRIREELTKTL